MGNLLLYSAASLALFMIGANVAFFFNLERIVNWFKFKIIAVSLILGYVAVSLITGNPGTGQVIFALFAIMADLCALLWMWWEIEHLRVTGTVGLIPLVRAEEED